jgi:hypothetical protein
MKKISKMKVTSISGASESAIRLRRPGSANWDACCIAMLLESALGLQTGEESA